MEFDEYDVMTELARKKTPDEQKKYDQKYAKWFSESFCPKEFCNRMGFEIIEDNTSSSPTVKWPDYVIEKDGKEINLEVRELSKEDAPKTRALNIEGKRLCGGFYRKIKGKWEVSFKEPISFWDQAIQIAEEVERVILNAIQSGRTSHVRNEKWKYVGKINLLRDTSENEGELLYRPPSYFVSMSDRESIKGFEYTINEITHGYLQKVIEGKSEKIKDENRENWLLLTIINLDDYSVLDNEYDYRKFNRIFYFQYFEKHIQELKKTT